MKENVILCVSAQGFALSAQGAPRDVPAVVLRHGRVVEANSLARGQGIATMLTTSAVKALCPSAVLLEEDAEAALQQRERWLKRCARWALAVEPLDEHTSLLDWSGFADGGRQALVALLEDTRTMGVEVAVGWGVGRLSARIALRRALRGGRRVSAIHKPLQESLWHLPLSLLPETYAETVEQCRRVGWKRFGALGQVSLQQAVALVGRHVAPVWYLVQGQDDSRVQALYPPPEWRWAGDFPDGLTEEMASALWHRLSLQIERRLRDRSAVGTRLELGVLYCNTLWERWEAMPMPPLQRAQDIASQLGRLWWKRRRQLCPLRWRVRVVWETNSCCLQPVLQERTSPHGDLHATVQYLASRFGLRACFRPTLSHSSWNRQMRRFYEPHDLSLYTGGMRFSLTTASGDAGTSCMAGGGAGAMGGDGAMVAG